MCSSMKPNTPASQLLEHQFGLPLRVSLKRFHDRSVFRAGGRERMQRFVRESHLVLRPAATGTVPMPD